MTTSTPYIAAAQTPASETGFKTYRPPEIRGRISDGLNKSTSEKLGRQATEYAPAELLIRAVRAMNRKQDASSLWTYLAFRLFCSNPTIHFKDNQ